MMTYHTTAIGFRHGALRIERHIDASTPAEAAQRALWETEAMTVSVNSIITRPKMEGGWGPMRVFARDDLRAPFYSGELARIGMSVNARHLPAEERQALTLQVESRALPGMLGPGSVAIIASRINPVILEDELPILSTLVQIAKDEGVDWLVFDVEGPYLDDASTYPE